MKKMSAFVLTVLFVILPLSVFAGSDYYNLSFMDTAQVLKTGKVMIMLHSDSGFTSNDSSGIRKTSVLEALKGSVLAGIVTEGLEIGLDYDHAINKFFDGTDASSTAGNVGINLKYGFGLGEVVRMSLGFGGSFILDGAFKTLDENGTPRVSPSVCLSTKLGNMSAHLQFLDDIYFNKNTSAWTKLKLGIVYDFESVKAAIMGGYENVNSSDHLFSAGPEIIWNAFGPFNLNTGFILSGTGTTGSPVYGRLMINAALLF
jgi:hypothetical protein